MEITPKNLLIFGAILLFVGICLPFFLIAQKGFGGSSTMNSRKRKEYRTPRQIFFDIIWGSIVILFILPLILSTLYHFIKNVFWGGMPFNDFTHSFPLYSYEPIFHFYRTMFFEIQSLLTQQPDLPK
ncbi:MAG: hypothetical protein EOM53_05905 [Alphaproteobacteria bacterium]|nr:hypothetical protein [Alphaproteobacteria bacterium]